MYEKFCIDSIFTLHKQPLVCIQILLYLPQPGERPFPFKKSAIFSPSQYFTSKKLKTILQECIPVGCIPPAAVAVLMGLHQAPPREQAPPSNEQTSPGSRHPPQSRHLPGTRHPPVDRMTDTCKNITFANFVFGR